MFKPLNVNALSECGKFWVRTDYSLYNAATNTYNKYTEMLDQEDGDITATFDHVVIDSEGKETVVYNAVCDMPPF